MVKKYTPITYCSQAKWASHLSQKYKNIFFGIGASEKFIFVVLVPGLLSFLFRFFFVIHMARQKFICLQICSTRYLSGF
jgi:hypothetical protein